MLTYVCDWCGRYKKPRERWIVGLAAEHRGATADRCEIAIADRWSKQWARHPFAIHFCSKDHKERYVSSVFAPFHDAEDASRAQGGVTAVKPPTKKSKQRRRRPRKVIETRFSEPDHLRARAWGIKLD
jgi:hypothetical protein